ncbi:MAG: hypothetical protein ACK4MJ_05725 [Hylemonella sp.]
MADDDLRALLPRYGLPADAPLRLLNRSENDTWSAGEGADAIILRQHRAGYHSRAEIVSELDWLAALQAWGVGYNDLPVGPGSGSDILAAAG